MNEIFNKLGNENCYSSLVEKKNLHTTLEYGDSLIGPNVSLCNHQPCHVGCIQ